VEQILTRARDIQGRQEADEQRLRTEAEDRRRCEQAVREFDEAVGMFCRSQDPFVPNRVDPKTFFPGIFAALAAACQVYQECGFGSRWAKVDGRRPSCTTAAASSRRTRQKWLSTMGAASSTLGSKEASEKKTS
jgi:hypothetical protein